MFRIALALSLMVSQPAFADEDADEYCGLLARYAGHVMAGRQEERPIGEFMTDLPGNDPLYRIIIVEAYEHVGFRSEDAKRRAVASFSNDVATQCYRAVMNSQDGN